MKIVFCTLDPLEKVDCKVSDNWTLLEIAIAARRFKKMPYFFVEQDASWKRYYINGTINNHPSRDFRECGLSRTIEFDDGRTVFSFNDEDEQLFIR